MAPARHVPLQRTTRRTPTGAARIARAFAARRVDRTRLLKGWDLARLYQSSALRPYEDIDFIVRDDGARRAESVVVASDTNSAIVDFVHEEITCARSPSTGDDFDWAHCVGNAHPQDQWIGCAIGLARELLGCHIRPEAAPYESPLPRWLIPAVFAMWVRSAEHGLDERWAVREFLE